MDFLPETISDYIEEHSTPEPSLLTDLSRHTHLKMLYPQMLSGNLQGQFLKMISFMLAPSCILEIGTYTGYSAICMAEGLAPGGILHTIDINEELKSTIEEYLRRAGMDQKVRLHIGNALSIIPTLAETPDLVFIDADKVNYPNYYDMVVPLMKKGGFIVADNVLWSGKVTETDKDEETAALDLFNKKVTADDRVENLILPLRDGLMIIRKK